MVNMLPVDEHAWKLDCIFRNLYFDTWNNPWYQVSNWLQMASSIDKVDLITEKFDSSIGFCSGAVFYEEQRSILLSNLAKELTVFNFIWGAFESLVEYLVPLVDGCNLKYGKVSCAIYILRKKRTPVISGYDEKLNKLFNLYKSVITSDVSSDHVTFKGKGIYIVYKIRNKLAHGSYQFPSLPEEYSGERIQDMELIKISSSIVLLTIQMLLYAYFFEKDIQLNELFFFHELYDIDTIPLNTLLESIHTEEFKEMFIEE